MSLELSGPLIGRVHCTYTDRSEHLNQFAGRRPGCRLDAAPKENHREGRAASKGLSVPICTCITATSLVSDLNDTFAAQAIDKVMAYQDFSDPACVSRALEREGYPAHRREVQRSLRGVRRAHPSYRNPPLFLPARPGRLGIVPWKNLIYQANAAQVHLRTLYDSCIAGLCAGTRERARPASAGCTESFSLRSESSLQERPSWRPPARTCSRARPSCSRICS